MTREFKKTKEANDPKKEKSVSKAGRVYESIKGKIKSIRNKTEATELNKSLDDASRKLESEKRGAMDSFWNYVNGKRLMAWWHEDSKQRIIENQIMPLTKMIEDITKNQKELEQEKIEIIEKGSAEFNAKKEAMKKEMEELLTTFENNKEVARTYLDELEIDKTGEVRKTLGVHGRVIDLIGKKYNAESKKLEKLENERQDYIDKAIAARDAELADLGGRKISLEVEKVLMMLWLKS